MTSIQRPCSNPFILLVLALAWSQINAQDLPASAEDAPEIVTDKFDRGTPSRSMAGFLAAADQGDYETAAAYLDLRNLRGEASTLSGPQLARRFYVIGQRATWVDIDDLVDDPDGRSNDNLPDYRDSIGVILEEGEEIRLLMQKVPRNDGAIIWKISNATVALIPELYRDYGYPEAVEALRRQLPAVTFLGYELFKWVIVVAVAVLAYGSVLLIALVIRRPLGDPNTPTNRHIFRFLTIPGAIWVVIMSVNIVATTLGRGVAAKAWQSVSPIATLATVWLLISSLGVVRHMYSTYLDRRGRPNSLVLIHPATTAIKLLIIVIATLLYLHKLGINITALLAGLGIGGIAVALALQKPLEDMLGAVNMFTQQPVRVGDFCRIGEYTGTIEEIGLRGTRVRTLDHTLITIPNAKMATEAITNISARKKIRYRPVLRLRYDTTPDQLRHVLQGIRGLFASHDQVVKDDHRVQFTEFGDDALLIEADAYLATTDWNEYLKLAEELNMRILEIVAASGTGLSLPARTLHVEQSAAPDKPKRTQLNI